jgi:CheY-like chemotaxis protein
MPLIIIADDDPVFTEMVSTFLVGNGYEAVVAYGVAQLDMLIAKRRPDAAIVDMQMPSGGGPAAVRLLRERLVPPIPIIVVSGMPVPQTLKWFAGVPRLAALQKPADLFHLRTELARLLAGG